MSSAEQLTESPPLTTHPIKMDEDAQRGPRVANVAAVRPHRKCLYGQTVTIEPLSVEHADNLFDCLGGNQNTALWDYIPEDAPTTDRDTFRSFILRKAKSEDLLFFAIKDNSTQNAIGFFALMRIDVGNRVVEIGNIVLSPMLQRSTAATETMYLVAKWVFEELHFRRYEWKCNDLNGPSKRAAERLGFVFEGVFRQHMIARGRNRDTAWFSMIDGEWEGIKGAFEKWLDPANFDSEGKQKRSLASFRSG